DEYVPFRTLHCRDRVVSSGCDFKAWGRFQNSVSVAHPHATHVVEQTRGFNRIEFPRSILALRRRFNTASQFLSNELHSITNAQNRNAKFENPRIANRSIGLVNGGRSAG